MDEFFELLKAKGKCCCCETPLADSQFINGINIQCKATWAYPVWGNVYTREENMACGYACDECFERGLSGEPVTVRFALEADEDSKNFVFHPIECIDGSYQLVNA